MSNCRHNYSVALLSYDQISALSTSKLGWDQLKQLIMSQSYANSNEIINRYRDAVIPNFKKILVCLFHLKGCFWTCFDNYN